MPQTNDDLDEPTPKPADASLSRRDLLTALGGAATLALTGCSGSRPQSAHATLPEPTGRQAVAVGNANVRMPSIYLPHGGGPWPWTPAFTPSLARDYVHLRRYLESIPDQLPQRPVGIVIVSAHWEAAVATVMPRPEPRMLYDYGGFPADTYTIEYPAPGSPVLASRVHELLNGSGIETATNTERGMDHGAFVPMKLLYPNADIPTIQLSLDAGYDPRRHLAMGRALSPLRDEGVLIIGSGMSWEDFRAHDRVRRSEAFDVWFQKTAVADPATRDLALLNWTEAPFARAAHPHEEHLLPMMVAAGAAGEDVGRVAFTGSLLGMRVSAVHFNDGAKPA